MKIIYSLPNDISDKEIDGVIYSHSTDGCGNCDGEYKCKGCKYPLHKHLYRRQMNELQKRLQNQQ